MTSHSQVSQSSITKMAHPLRLCAFILLLSSAANAFAPTAHSRLVGKVAIVDIHADILTSSLLFFATFFVTCLRHIKL